jgi:hypothetical protein
MICDTEKMILHGVKSLYLLSTHHKSTGPNLIVNASGFILGRYKRNYLFSTTGSIFKALA